MHHFSYRFLSIFKYRHCNRKRTTLTQLDALHELCDLRFDRNKTLLRCNDWQHRPRTFIYCSRKNSSPHTWLCFDSIYLAVCIWLRLRQTTSVNSTSDHILPFCNWMRLMRDGRPCQSCHWHNELKCQNNFTIRTVTFCWLFLICIASSGNPTDNCH